MLLLLAACVEVGPHEGLPQWVVYEAPPQTDLLVEEVFVQAVAERVDVLFVVQDTPGADVAQAAVATNADELFDRLQGVDLHVGVVRADLADEGVLVEADGVRWLDSGTPDPAGTFAAMVDVGVDGALPQPTGAAYAALELQRDAANAGFLRDDGAVHVVLVGDGEDATDIANVDPAGFVPWFEGLATARSVSCLVDLGLGGDVDACRELVLAVGDGVAVDLAAADEGMSRVGEVALGIEHTYALSRIPVDGTLEVEVEDADGTILPPFGESDVTWDPVSNAVTFVTYVPGPGATIRVRYEPAS